jgi:hypothetical protein
VTPSPSAEQLALLGNSPTPVAETEDAAVAEAADSEAEVTPEVSDDGTPSPTATPYTEELYQQSYQEYITSLEEIGVSEKYLRLYVYHYLLDQKSRKRFSRYSPGSGSGLGSSYFG